MSAARETTGTITEIPRDALPATAGDARNPTRAAVHDAVLEAVREQDAKPSGAVALHELQELIPNASAAAAIEEQLDAVQREMNGMRDELTLLRRRDETL